MNKIKNIIILVMAFIATSVFAACNDDDDNVITSHVVLNPETVEFSADGGTQTVTANGNAPVKTITSDASWLKAEAGSFLPTKLTQPVILTADKNTTSSARTATVTITAGTLTLTIPVSQASGNGSTEDRPGSISGAAMDLAPNMYPGWNLGNTLEAVGGETGWQHTVTTKAVIDYVKAQGFKSVRIPTAWMIHADATGKIDQAWMSRVKEIVNYCIDDGLYVVLNDHWDNGWIEVDGFSKSHDSYQPLAEADIAAKADTLKNLWTQIATAFKAYGDHLLFAGLNEPFQEYNLFSTHHAELTPILQRYNQAFVDAVRATGGNNAKRTLVVQGPSVNIGSTTDAGINFTMPTDQTGGSGRLMVEVHYYEPWTFCSANSTKTWGSADEVNYMKDQFSRMKSKFADNGYPVILGEYGVNWQENSQENNNSIQLFCKSINEYGPANGIIPFVWDINSTTLPTMTIIDRANLKVFCPYALDGIKAGVSATTWTK